MWFDGPFNGLTITGSRIDSTLADGINFHRNITNSSVTQTVIRGTGDDGLAMWSSSDNVPATGDSNDSFDHNTVQSPYLANGIAIYGGNGNSVTNDVVTDSQYRGGGIMLDYENFGNSTVPFAGTTTVQDLYPGPGLGGTKLDRGGSASIQRSYQWLDGFEQLRCLCSGGLQKGAAKAICGRG